MDLSPCGCWPLAGLRMEVFFLGVLSSCARHAWWEGWGTLPTLLSHDTLPAHRPNPTLTGHSLPSLAGNPVVSWMMGYLNYQVIHHLFPAMPQFRGYQCHQELQTLAKWVHRGSMHWGSTHRGSMHWGSMHRAWACMECGCMGQRMPVLDTCLSCWGYRSLICEERREGGKGGRMRGKGSRQVRMESRVS